MSELAFKGMIRGMEMMGAEFVGLTDNEIYFNISKDSELHKNERALIKARDVLKELFGLTLKVKRT